VASTLIPGLDAYRGCHEQAMADARDVGGIAALENDMQLR
jgi:hypothetical protein